MGDKYEDIDSSFGFFRSFTPPFGKLSVGLGQSFLSLAPKTIRSDKQKRVIPLSIPGKDGSKISATLIEPLDLSAEAPCLVYAHGGGFVYGPAPYQYRNCAEYALRAKCKVVFVNYSLAPKHRFPVPENEVLEAFRWVVANREALGIDPKRIAVGGDSAGGYLACETIRQTASETKPCFALLIFPVCDPRQKTDSMRRYQDAPMWNARLNQKMWEYHLGEQSNPPAPEDYAGDFPPCYIETAQYDCLHDEAVLLALKISERGIPITLNRTLKTMHGFDIVGSSPITQRALESRISALRKAFKD